MSRLIALYYTLRDILSLINLITKFSRALKKMEKILPYFFCNNSELKKCFIFLCHLVNNSFI